MRKDLLAIILATLAFSFWGYVWYATVFDDVWQNLISTSESDLLNVAINRGAIQYLYVILISLLQVMAIFISLKWTRAKSFPEYMCISMGLSTLVVLPSIGNTTLFVGTPLGLLMLDYGYFLFGYAGIALVFFIILPSNPKKLRK
jgi:hypothetical protein